MKKACEHCGGLFQPRKSQLDAGGGRYCSHACFNSERATARTKWVAARVTPEQARLVREMGGASFLRGLIEEKVSELSPARLDDVWRRAA